MLGIQPGVESGFEFHLAVCSALGPVGAIVATRTIAAQLVDLEALTDLCLGPEDLAEESFNEPEHVP